MKRWIRCVEQCLASSLAGILFIAISLAVILGLALLFLVVAMWTLAYVPWPIWLIGLWVIICIACGTVDWWKYHR